jgi:hypothetical protein
MNATRNRRVFLKMFRKVNPPRSKERELPQSLRLSDPGGAHGWPKRERYSIDKMKALTISARRKSPPNELSFASQKS